jgi:hypothetical protein
VISTCLGIDANCGGWCSVNGFAGPAENMLSCCGGGTNVLERGYDGAAVSWPAAGSCSASDGKSVNIQQAY